jgi:hypothetical protein
MTGKEIFHIQTEAIDPRVFSNLIVQLNISRRNSQSYPKGHQVVDATLHKVLHTYGDLRSTGEELVIGVACDTLLIGNTPLEKTNRVFRDFARVLYERGIGALVLHRGLTIHELRNFVSILGARREDIDRDGGIQSIWEKSGISSIEIRPICYDSFTATEEARIISDDPPEVAPEGLWERFARGLVNGQLATKGTAEDSPDPELLTGILSEQLTPLDSHDLNYGLDLSPFMGQDDICHDTGIHQPDLAYRKLSEFVAKLTPGLRRQFLTSTFDVKKIKNESIAEGIICQLPADMVVDTLEDINRNQVSVPPFILSLLLQMSQHASSGQRQSAIGLNAQDLQQRMNTVFKEDNMTEFIPESYQVNLNQLASSDEFPLLGLEGVQDLMSTMDAPSMEKQTSNILVTLLVSGSPTEEGYDKLTKNLDDTCTFFLQTGEYSQLFKILRRIGGEDIPAGTRDLLLGLFARREFLDELINGLQVWGKAKREEICALLEEIGEPCIEILLDRLAEAESMSLRRFLMDRLVEFGPVAGPAIVRRLSDDRWYFLRNIVAIISMLNLTSSLEKLRPLADHPDPRVSQEALKVLQQFNDPKTESRIILDLKSPNREIRIAAVRIVGKCTSQIILDLLHTMLARPGLSEKECEMKSAVVQALGEAGSNMSLAPLEKLLASRNLLHPLRLNRLKLEVVGSLWRYPAQASRPILERIAQEKGKPAQRAAHLLTRIPGLPS